LELINTATSAVTAIGSTGVNVNFGDLAASPTAGLGYMVNCCQSDLDSSLYSLNLATGAAMLVGETDVVDMFGLAYDPDNSTLYGTTYTGPTQDLYSVNTSTGTASLIGPTSIGASREKRMRSHTTRFFTD
jgi:hypothetical protein